MVEDERRLSDALVQILTEAKYQAEAVYNGDDGLSYALSGLYDVVVLDVMMPGMDGFEVVRQLRREHCAVPVLMLTAKSELIDKVHGLDMGADDYMTKPFAPEELLARVRALSPVLLMSYRIVLMLARVRALSRRQGDVALERMEFGDAALDLNTCDLSCGERSVHLGYKEFEILRILMANPRMLVPKEDLIVKVWGADSEAMDNNVEAYISFLRKKLAFVGAHVTITARRKVGYRLEESDA